MDIARFVAMSDLHRPHVRDSLVFIHYVHVFYTMTFHYTPIFAYDVSARARAKNPRMREWCVPGLPSLSRKAWVRGYTGSCIAWLHCVGHFVCENKAHALTNEVRQLAVRVRQ